MKSVGAFEFISPKAPTLIFKSPDAYFFKSPGAFEFPIHFRHPFPMPRSSISDIAADT